MIRKKELNLKSLIEPDTHTPTGNKQVCFSNCFISPQDIFFFKQVQNWGSRRLTQQNLIMFLVLLNSYWAELAQLAYCFQDLTFFFLLSFRGSAATPRNCYRTLPTLGMPSLKAWWCSAGGMTTTTTRTGGSWESRASMGSSMTGRLTHCANLWLQCS